MPALRDGPRLARTRSDAAADGAVVVPRWQAQPAKIGGSTRL